MEPDKEPPGPQAAFSVFAGPSGAWQSVEMARDSHVKGTRTCQVNIAVTHGHKGFRTSGDLFQVTLCGFVLKGHLKGSLFWLDTNALTLVQVSSTSVQLIGFWTSAMSRLSSSVTKFDFSILLGLIYGGSSVFHLGPPNDHE